MTTERRTTGKRKKRGKKKMEVTQMSDKAVAEAIRNKIAEQTRTHRLHIATMLLANLGKVENGTLLDLPGDVIDSYLEHALNVADMLIELNAKTPLSFEQP
jgi:hypothetical protein